MLTETEHALRRRALQSRLIGKRRALDEALLLEPENAEPLRTECATIERQIEDLDAARRAAERREVVDRSDADRERRAQALMTMQSDAEEVARIGSVLANAIIDAGKALTQLDRVAGSLRKAKYTLLPPGARASFGDTSIVDYDEICAALKEAGLLRNPGGVAQSIDLSEIITARARNLAASARRAEDDEDEEVAA